MREFATFRTSDWLAPAEAPPGRVPAHVSVNHFLFDSWVHERDLLLPAGELPPTEPGEAAAVASYVVALAGSARMDGDDGDRPATAFEITTTDINLCLRAERDASRTVVTIEATPTGGPRLVGAVGDVVDHATGRGSGDRLQGDPAALAFLSNLSVVMA